MTLRMKAAVCRELNQPVVVETITLDPPGPGEVLVKLAACGICHSDLSATNGTIPQPLPLILGHEGAGVIVEVGQGVKQMAVGDHVLSSFASMCGKCRYCSAGKSYLCDQSMKAQRTLPDGSLRTRDASGVEVGVFAGCGVMAEYAVLSVDNVVKIDATMPLDKAALISCGVMTGVGAATNTAKVEAGSITLVLGCGGVGLNTIQGCAISGAAMIVAVDTSDYKLELAQQFGATHTVNSSREENLAKTLRKLTGGGADYAFDCVGLGETSAIVYGATAKGGTAVIVGVASATDTTSFRTRTMTFDEKTLRGSYYGSTRPHLDFPRLIALYRGGRLKLDELITTTYTIDEAPQAFADMVAGRNARGVILF
ncbi:MAG: Zn-dependent alcohol dehydrogenase [Proteobacteria bacterium]|nr:Zn-dependent alcohol dehydrogenase [Pseudomonadota bacterium]HQR03345.1 Zn-dependent alcohol dehydrogenase [Rhodocyclaceae bacterium]